MLTLNSDRTLRSTKRISQSPQRISKDSKYSLTKTQDDLNDNEVRVSCKSIRALNYSAL